MSKYTKRDLGDISKLLIMKYLCLGNSEILISLNPLNFNSRITLFLFLHKVYGQF